MGISDNRTTERCVLLLALVLALLAALPFLVARYPQMSDYPAHLARYYVMLEVGRNPVLAAHYGFEWKLTGNLGVDLLVRALAPLFGLEAAGKWTAAMIPPLTGLGLIAVSWALHRRVTPGALLAFAAIWSPAMSLGMTNFALSLALALFAFAAWVRLERWRWRAWLFLPLCLVLWLCHVAGWGVLGLLVLGYELHRRRNPTALLATWPLTLPLFPLLFGSGTKGMIGYGAHVQVYKTGIWLKALRDQSQQLDLFTLAALLLVIAWALARKRLDGRLGWAALLLAAATIVMPRHFAGGDYADYRLIAVALMVGCLAIDVSRPRWLLALAPLLFLVRLAVTAQAWDANDRVLRQELAALEAIPRGARVAGAVAVDQRRWALDPFEHVPSYATIARDALVNSHFALPGVHMLTIRSASGDFNDPAHRILWFPHRRIDLARFRSATEADYLWYIGPREPDSMPTGAQVLLRRGHHFVARLAKPGDRR